MFVQELNRFDRRKHRSPACGFIHHFDLVQEFVSVML